jgi:hypothetical protein
MREEHIFITSFLGAVRDSVLDPKLGPIRIGVSEQKILEQY